MVDKEKLLEECAAEEHERWARWYRWQRDNSTPENIARWNRQAETPYVDLSEQEKESDRREVRTKFGKLFDIIEGLERK